MRPVRPPPRERDPPPPPYPGPPGPPAPPPPSAKTAAKSKLGLKISNPVLTGSTNKDSQSDVKKSPAPVHKDPIVRPPPPKFPTKGAKQTTSNNGANKPLIKESEKNTTTTGSTTKFSPPFKIPSFSKTDKQEPEQKEEPPVANIVKKRELTRDISNPILISTTDRRSKHLVKNDSFTVNQDEGSVETKLAPPVPPHVSLNRSESDTARRNRPLPPRPLSMPESECGEDLQRSGAGSRKSANLSTQSPRMPDRPPPPPIKPHFDNTRKNIEDELAKLDQIQIKVPEETDSPRGSPHPKAKDIKPKPKPSVGKSLSDPKKPTPPAKNPATKTEDKKTATKQIQRPVFNPKNRPGLSNNSSSSAIDKKAGKTSKAVSDTQRKVSTNSLDEDTNTGSAGVSGIAKMFEGQKKPLLGDKSVTRTQSHGTPKAPMTPPKPKPGAKKIRSVDV